MFMALPAGVPTPPMRQAMGRPSITALPNGLAPGSQRFFSSRRTATGSIMATTGMSARKVDRSAETIIRKNSRREGLPRERRLVHRTTRRFRPEFWKAMEIQNIAKTKKTVGVAKWAMTLGRGMMPATTGSRVNRMDDTAMGMTSNTQTSTAASIMAMAFLPTGVSTSGAGRAVMMK